MFGNHVPPSSSHSWRVVWAQVKPPAASKQHAPKSGGGLHGSGVHGVLGNQKLPGIAWHSCWVVWAQV